MRLPHGTFGWIDLSAKDQEAATAFYTALFGLDAVAMPVTGGGTYTMLQRGGRNVAGIGTAPFPGMPAMWQSYIVVDDVDDVVARVERLGGSVLQPSFDVMDSGRMAVIADPAGAVVSLWQAGRHEGADVFNEPGTHCWNELSTRDTEAAERFYSELVGWTWTHMDQGEDQPRYGVSHVAGAGEDDQGNGGCMDVSGVVPDEVPPHWDVYFAVEDADAAAEKAIRLGGRLVAGPMDIEVGRWAYLADPEGAMFYVLAMTG